MGGVNLIGSTTSANPVSYQESDITNVIINLLPLQLTFGSTPIFGLPPGSPAIDGGDNELSAATIGLTFDQRGLKRLIDGDADGIIRADIGSVEEGQQGAPSGALVLGRIFNANGKPISGAIVKIVTEEQDYQRVTITNPFGYFRLGTPAGRYCTLTVTSKRASFLPKIIMTSRIRRMLTW